MTANAEYRFSVIAVYGTDNRLPATPVDQTANLIIDSDADTLIDIHNLDMLNNVRCSLDGTSYLTADSGGTCASTGGLQCGTDGTTTCTGYELIRNLDFANGTSYARNGVNNNWRPTTNGTVVPPATATNAGWVPIGPTFASTFGGNNNTISNLYVRSSGQAGFFNILTGTVRNLGVVNSAVYGSSNVGGLVGTNSGTITASYASGGTANSGTRDLDSVGGLVGFNSNGTIIASYASGTANGGAGDRDSAGGLVGTSYTTTIAASYASGTANGGADDNDFAGGLVGSSYNGTIAASYATSNANGGAGTGDSAGALVGANFGATFTASYGFRTTTGGETAGFTASTPAPASAAAIAGTNAGCSDGTNKIMSACTGGALRWVTWATEANSAWNFGTTVQPPALKYADYDGAGTGVDYCALFPAKILGTNTDLVCGTTLLPGQGR